MSHDRDQGPRAPTLQDGLIPTEPTVSVSFAPRGRSASALLVQPRPHGNPGYTVYGGLAEAPAVYIHRRVLAQLRTGALEAAPNETIGVLLGRPCRDERGTYVIVEAAVTARPDEYQGTPGAVRISAAGRNALNRRAGRRYPVLEVIGWWHSHPHGAPRYSGVDLDEQATYPQPYHVGVVVAAQRYETEPSERRAVDPLGVYVGPGANRLQRIEDGQDERPLRNDDAPPRNRAKAVSESRPRRIANDELDQVRRGLRRVWQFGAFGTVLMLVAIAGSVLWAADTFPRAAVIRPVTPAPLLALSPTRVCYAGEQVSVPVATPPDLEVSPVTATADAMVVSTTFNDSTSALVITCGDPGRSVISLRDARGAGLTVPVRVKAEESTRNLLP